MESRGDGDEMCPNISKGMDWVTIQHIRSGTHATPKQNLEAKGDVKGAYPTEEQAVKYQCVFLSIELQEFSSCFLFLCHYEKYQDKRARVQQENIMTILNYRKLTLRINKKYK